MTLGRVAPLAAALQALQQALRKLRAHVVDIEEEAAAVQRESESESAVLTLTLDMPYSEWGAAASERVSREVAAVAGVTPEQVEIVKVRAGSCIVEMLLHTPEQEACNARLAADMSNPHGLLRRNLGAISFVTPASVPPLPTQQQQQQQQQQVHQLVQVCVPRAAMHSFRCMCRIDMLLTAAPASTAAAAAPGRVDRRPERTCQRPRSAKPRHTHPIKALRLFFRLYQGSIRALLRLY